MNNQVPLKKRRLAVFCIGVSACACALAAVGALLMPQRAAALIFTVVVCAASAIGAAVFEHSRVSPLRISLTSVMTALSVVGRVAFYAVPFFKPVSAAVILCGMWLGPVSGMVCGALSALLSGVFFGYGIWLPFQMTAWGLIGLLAGLMSAPLKKSRTLLSAYGVMAAVFFSAFMDVFTVLEFAGGFSITAYSAAILTAVPITLIYAASNVIFLLALARPVGRRLDRIEQKYGKI